MAALPEAACDSICSMFPFSQCLDWLSPVFRMHVQKHGVSANLGVTLQQSSFTLVLLPILHKLFPDKSCKMVLMTPVRLFAGESVLRHFASQAASEAVSGRPVVTGACPRTWGHLWRCGWEVSSFSSKGHPLGQSRVVRSSSKHRALQVREGKLKCCCVWSCSCLLSSSRATPWACCLEEVAFSAQLLPRGEFPCACLQHSICQQDARVLAVFCHGELAPAWGKGQRWDVFHDRGEARCPPWFPPHH